MALHLTFGRWVEVFGDQTVAAAIIDQVVHHADVLSLKGASYRMKSQPPAADAIVETVIAVLFYVSSVGNRPKER